jgi:very-short-patch-repair endonuclease
MARMPASGFFCGPTAALIQGVPLPRRLEADPVLHVGVPAGSRALRVRNVRGHKLGVHRTAIRVWRGLPVTEPARTWLDLAPFLGLADLVAAGDHLLHGDPSSATFAELEHAVRSAAHARGVRLLRAALPLLDGRAESRAESRLRLVLVHARIEGFEPNFWVTLQRPRVRYRIDIAFPREMLGVEYQSEYHHDPDQWRRDMTRLSRLRAAGWTMVEVSQADLDDPRELAHRIHAHLAQLRGHK